MNPTPIKLSLLFCFFLLAQLLPAQEVITKEIASSRLLKGLEDAEQAIADNDLSKALSELQKVLEKEPRFVDALFLRGSVFYDQKHYNWAEGDFEMAIHLAPGYNKVALFQLAVIEWRLRKFQEAADHFEAYLASDSTNERQRELAVEYLEKARFSAQAYDNAVPFDPIRLNDAVNTDEQEYLPALTADGNTLIFTAVVRGQEDFFRSEKVDGAWTAREPLDGVNTRGNEGAQSISADGKFLVFTACQRRDAIGRCDLYFTEQVDGEWLPVKNIGAPINTAAWESQPSISANRDQLFFASDRDGGRGKKDIWVSNRQADGSWGKPLNLGEQINTKGDDKAPFIHADGKTLYFMSDGHPGLGGFDLFYSRLDENGQWQKPVNLGFPINTESDEGLMIVDLKGTTAYFATDRNAVETKDSDKPQTAAGRLIPNYDIYSFDLYEAAQPSPATYVEGTVVDATTGEPLEAAFSIGELNGNKNWVNRNTGADGQFLAVLPAGEDYSLHVTKPGYAFYSDYFALSAVNTVEKPFKLLIELQPIGSFPDLAGPEKAPIRLNNIFFETGSAALLEASEVELQILLELLQSNPEVRIEVHGHTDNVGSEADNQQLSEARAKAVVDYLKAKGISADRLSFRGFGESEPLATNDTEAGRRQNRRTEFVILP